jgi:hypothetical protein
MKHSAINQQTEPLGAALEQRDHQLTDEHLASIKAFVEEVGGVENARQALLALTEYQKAA